MKPIVLNVRTLSEECAGVVRLSPEAEKIVRRLSLETNLSIRYIVSEIIVQAEDLIEIKTGQAGG